MQCDNVTKKWHDYMLELLNSKIIDDLWDA